MNQRPSFSSMWTHFQLILGDGTVQSVGQKIGGKVGYNIELGQTSPTQGFTNACAIRMSYCLNRCGVPIPHGPYAVSSGADHYWYIYRVRDMLAFLNQSFGPPDLTSSLPRASDFAGQAGIHVFDVRTWSDASGHVTLWDGKTCSDHCYHPQAQSSSLWLLPE